MAERKHKILVVEDNEINREILNEILSDDYDMLFAENGVVGMRLLRKHNAEIDLVLLDIMMPIMDGYQVLEEVSRDSVLKEIPIVVTTSSNHTDDEIRCLKMGASDFVPKPYNPIVVRLRVDRIIHLRESMLSNMQKTMFIQNMRHEVRTPLNAIMGFAQMLCMPEGMLNDSEREEYANYIMNNSNMLMRMIDDMLALSDIENGTLKLDISNVSLNEVCNSAVSSTKFSHPDGVKVYYTSEVPYTFTIKSDGSRVQQALVNLLTNACKFTKSGEIHVHCSVSEVPGRVALSVADTGCGIPLSEATNIFERFKKLDAFTPGSGLGLSIVASIAEHLNGKVYLDTRYTKGARFVFELPLDSSYTPYF